MRYHSTKETMNRLVTAGSLLLLTLIAYFAVHLFYTIVDYKVQAACSPVQPLVTREEPIENDNHNATRHSLAFFQPVISRDLFKTGKSKIKLPEPAVSTADLKTTDLNIKLWGTVTGKGLSAKYAVIESKGDSRRMEQHLYREGDTIEDARIEKIMDNKIILSKGGDRQILQMEKFIHSGRGSRISRRTGRSYPRRAMGTTSRRRTYTRTISRRMVEDATKNFDKLITQVRVVPAADGMKIASMKSSSFFRRLGLRRGDVITSVNDQKITSVQDAMNVYKQLQQGNSITVGLKRHNRQRTINYNIR